MRWNSWLLCGWLIVLGGIRCSSPPAVSFTPRVDLQLLVWPFENLTGRTEAAENFTHDLVFFLQGRGMDCVEMMEIRHFVTKNRLSPSPTLTKVNLQKLRSQFPVDAILVGTVHEYGVLANSQTPSLAVSARLFGWEGELVWSSGQTRTGEDDETFLKIGRVNSLAVLSRLTAEKMAVAMQEALPSIRSALGRKPQEGEAPIITAEVSPPEMGTPTESPPPGEETKEATPEAPPTYSMKMRGVLVERIRSALPYQWKIKHVGPCGEPIDWKRISGPPGTKIVAENPFVYTQYIDPQGRHEIIHPSLDIYIMDVEWEGRNTVDGILIESNRVYRINPTPTLNKAIRPATFLGEDSGRHFRAFLNQQKNVGGTWETTPTDLQRILDVR